MKLREAVHAKIQELNPTIADLVAIKIAEETIQKRVALIVSVLTEIDNKEKELRKLKPDIKTVTEDGVEDAKYSKTAYEDRKKIKERIEKLIKLVEAALEDPSKFAELSSFTGQHAEKA
jgi:hypothetical protein